MRPPHRGLERHPTRRRPLGPYRRKLLSVPVRERLAAPASADPNAEDWDANLVQLPEPMVRPFELVSDFQPAGGQPQAIEALVKGLEAGEAYQQLLGITGSGKTFSIANVVQQVQRPTLVLAHNKTLAAQLYSEFKELFPKNAVEYFVSYYDYYQPLSLIHI